MQVNYTVEYSNRKTIGIYIRDGKVLVRAPKKAPKSVINEFVLKNAEWIKTHLEKSLEKASLYDGITDEEKKKYKKFAREYFERKTKEYADIMGIKYGRISITSARKRFGSCSSKGNISYSYLLFLYPEAAREYVIVHELAHRVHMNHSKEFYRLIECYMPDYKIRKKLLSLPPTKKDLG